MSHIVMADNCPNCRQYEASNFEVGTATVNLLELASEAA